MIGNIYISGQIGDFDGVTGVNLIDVIGQVKKQPEALSFNVHINSEGGLVDVGFDIFNYLKSLGKPVTTIGSGIVASIATVIFMAGATRMIRENTPFMIHMPWGGGQGNADEMEAFTAELRLIEKQLTDFYKKELDLTPEAIEPLLKNETWLSPEQLTTLGFTNAEVFKAVAKTHFKLKNNDMTDNDKSWIEKTFSKMFAKLTPVKNKLVQDATGAELDFTDLADDAPIETGAAATIDGSPAEGEYTLPDGTVYVFSAGLLTEIKEPSGDDEVATLKAENERLTQELAAKDTAHTETIDDIKKEVVALKKQVTSKFSVETKKDTKKPDADTDRTAGIKDYLKTKKR